MKMNLWHRWHWLIGMAFTLAFMILLSVRIGLWVERPESRVETTPSTSNAAPRDNWFSIYQKGNKIGYAHRQFLSSDSGYRLSEDVFLRISTMGVVQILRFATRGDLDTGMHVLSFQFSLNSGLFQFAARGAVTDHLLTLYAGSSGEERRMEIPLSNPIHLSAGVFETSALGGLQAGERRTVYLFDPLTMGQRPVRIVRLPDEEIGLHNGQKERARKYSLDMMGVSQVAWVDLRGDVLREEGILGVTLEKAVKEIAVQGVDRGESFDVTEMASIAVNKEIPNPGGLDELRLKIDHLAKGAFFIDGGRQDFHDGVLRIRKEVLKEFGQQRGNGETSDFLKPSPLIQSDHPLIVKKAKEITAGSYGDGMKARKLVAWVYRNVNKQPVLSVPNALETLLNRKGDCNEHAVLLAALARAAGIPAEIEAGLVYLRGRFYYHAWTSLLLGEWVTADATLGQIPADVTHVRFVRGSLERQMNLLGLIGTVQVTVLSSS